jgi:hypothetical protein
MLVIYFGADRTGLAVYANETVAYEGIYSIDEMVNLLNRGMVLNAVSWKVF